MSWQREVDELRHRLELARQMGGPESVARQHSHGKLTVRERIELLADPGSFREFSRLAGQPTYENDELVAFTLAYKEERDLSAACETVLKKPAAGVHEEWRAWVLKTY